MIDDATFAILNAVYLKKFASVDGLAALAEAPVEEVDDAVVELARDELVVSTSAGVLLSAAGREQVIDYYQATYATVRADPDVVSWYERFEDVNGRFIALVSEWQHTGGDRAVEDRLLQVVGRLVKSLDGLVVKIPRYSSYARRLSASGARVDAGDRDFVANPRIDSIHNIWFEFHEDLLAVLGRPRDST